VKQKRRYETQKRWRENHPDYRKQWHLKHPTYDSDYYQKQKEQERRRKNKV
jgi:hypothetical protein